jgi:hypothetical protein
MIFEFFLDFFVFKYNNNNNNNNNNILLLLLLLLLLYYQIYGLGRTQPKNKVGPIST